MVSSVWVWERCLGLVEGKAIRELIRPVAHGAASHVLALHSSIGHDLAAVKETARKTRPEDRSKRRIPTPPRTAQRTNP
jgi:hypothetical protein